MTLHLDFETVATVDLRRTGVYRYAEDPDTDVILACYTDTGDAQTWRPGMPIPERIEQAVKTGETIHAWNAQFEYVLWTEVLCRKYMWPKPNLRQFDCAMARALYWGYPGSLGLCSQVMGHGYHKNAVGHALMLRMCRPRSFAANGRPVFWHTQDAVKYDELEAYCKDDVYAERACTDRLPPLPSYERNLWVLDQTMNSKGVPVDSKLVAAMTTLATDAQNALDTAMYAITGGQVSGPNATAALLNWLTGEGANLPDLRKETVKEAIRLLPNCPVRDALMLRRDGARASVAKLQAFAEAVCKDGTVKGMLRYYGAGRTGRWSGAGGAKVQPHNLVRGTITGVDHAIEMILGGCSPADLELLFEDSALGVIASCMRGCFSCL